MPYDWNPSEHVDKIDNLANISAKHILLNIGLDNNQKPARTFENLSQFKPIGVVQNITVGQNKMTQRFFEVGSGKSFIGTGPTIATFSATRTLIQGSTLLGLLKHGGQTAKSTFLFDLSDPVFDLPYVFVMLFYSPKVAENISEDISGILRSGFINSKEIIGAVALENCIISGHNMGLNAGDVLIFENVTFEVSRVKDLDVNFTTVDNSQLLYPSNTGAGTLA